MIRTEVGSATSSMTSVPKPLKFLKPHYDGFKEFYESQPDSDFKKLLADLISVLAMTMSEVGSNESLKFVLLGTKTDLIFWGHEYLRSLAGEIATDYNKRVEKGENTDELDFLVNIIVPYNMKNSEPEAVDLLIEVEKLHTILPHCNENNYQRVCNYLLSCAQFGADTEEIQRSLQVAFDIYMQQKKYPDALRVSQRQNNLENVTKVMTECKDEVTLKQMAFMIARQRTAFTCED